MVISKFVNSVVSISVAASLLFGGSSSVVGAQTGATPGGSTNMQMGGQTGGGGSTNMQMGATTAADRKAAAIRAQEARVKAGKPAGVVPAAAVASAQAVNANRNTDADYFGTTPNYANSPLPPSVVINDANGAGALITATVDVNGAVNGLFLASSGAGYVGDIAPDQVSLSMIGGEGTGFTGVATVINTEITLPVTITTPGLGYFFSNGIRKFVDTLPSVGVTNDLGNTLVVASADQATYPGSDYYEIGLVQYQHQFHKDLPPSMQRGYVQTGAHVAVGAACPNPQIKLVNVFENYTTGVTSTVNVHDAAGQEVCALAAPSYLGPSIVAQRDRPARIKFTNYLPTGSGGDLFIPTDDTVMGAGGGPQDANGQTCDSSAYTLSGSRYVNNCAKFTENRATLHLHGGLTPWISDGTPHQWTTPAGENTKYPQGVSVSNVPDMPDPGPGSLTFFYSNQQSARLMFYHDHAYGITRLNVYAGEAAGYLVQDPIEQALVNAGTIPADIIPLVIQDKAFVPGPVQLNQEDPTWITTTWGTKGNLWMPHVYMPNQNPSDPQNANAMGRWDYGPWFTAPTPVAYGLIPNPWYDPATTENPTVPGTANPSLTPEAFVDTPVVNGTAYPVMNVDPRAYRFRILSVPNDRFMNLSLYVAKANGDVWNGQTLLNNGDAGEVPMVPAFKDPTIPFPTSWKTATGGGTLLPDILDGRFGGVPDPRNLGPSWIQIGTEGGFLPTPTIIDPSPVGYDYNRRNVVVLNVSKHSLFLGPAERADVIVDFSQYAGKTLILYNDSPAPVPGFDPRNDYFTGDADQTTTGGAPTTLPGYGPNIRTVMQIRVSGTVGVNGTAYNTAPLMDAFKTTQAHAGVFAKDQDPIVVPQGAMAIAPGAAVNQAWIANPSVGYNSAYSGTFPIDSRAFPRLNDGMMTFYPLITTTTPNYYNVSPVSYTIDFGKKAIQELFTLDFGRMNATLGVEVPPKGVNFQTTIPYGYIDPITEIIDDNSVSASPVAVAGDGTQIWNIRHNGVDTHAIHFHLFNVQVLNRVGWDGQVKQVDPNELGWKETVRMNPLEDVNVALRPVAPKLPFGIPDSVRPLDPTMPLGTTMQFTGVDPNGNPVTVVNQLINYGWEFVWHCHLLGHEENDMMRPIKFNFTDAVPSAPTWGSLASTGSTGTAPQVVVTWNDPTPVTQAIGANWSNPKNEIGFRIERQTVVAGRPVNQLPPYQIVARALANATTFTDTTVGSNQKYNYRVVAYNAAGEATSTVTNTTTFAGTRPITPTDLRYTTTNTSIRLNWTANAANTTSYTITRTGGATPFAPVTVAGRTSNTWTDTTPVPGQSYVYTLVANNGLLTSAPTSITAVLPVAAPGNLRWTGQTTTSVSLRWNASGQNGVTYEVWRSTNGTTFGFLANAGTATTFTDGVAPLAALTTRTRYWYQVRAVVTATGLPSAFAGPVTGTTN